MGAIRVVSGTGTGPTTTAAHDAALLSAGVGNHNLVTVSSVVPPGATVETVETAPALGETGDRLTAVQARSVGERAAAALSWARGDDGRGLFYEGSARESRTDRGGNAAATEPDALRERALREAERGLTAGFDYRDWTPSERSSVAVAESVESDADAGADERDRHAAAVVLAVYGDGTALV